MLENANDLELAALRHIIAMADKPDKNGDRFICKYCNDELVLRPIEPAPAPPRLPVDDTNDLYANISRCKRDLKDLDLHMRPHNSDAWNRLFDLHDSIVDLLCYLSSHVRHLEEKQNA